MEKGMWKRRSWATTSEVSGRPFGLEEPLWRGQALRQTRSIWKSKALSLFTSRVLECESLRQAREWGYKWWMSHLNDTLQRLHHVLAGKSQENKWLSFKFQTRQRRQTVWMSDPHSIDFSAAHTKEQCPKGRETNTQTQPNLSCL